MRKRLQDQVRRRAREACEYCRMPQALYRAPFHVDHIISIQHGGVTKSSNLALACFHCNLHKGPNIAGFDPETGNLTRLYHPRDDRWDEHFTWNAAELQGLTDIGRTTIVVLAINDPLYVAVRLALMQEREVPPA